MCPSGTGNPAGVAGVTRVVLLDEYPALLESMVALVDGHPGFRVVGQARTGQDLLAIVGAQPVDMVIAEPWLRSGDGMDALREIARTHDHVLIVALSRVWDPQHVDPLVEIGARAYVPKSTDLNRIPPILHAAVDGLVTVPAVVQETGGPSLLTPREAEVLRMASDGLDNRAIAGALLVSERTVKFHLQNSYRKLGVTNRTAAAAAARRMGILV